MRFRRFKEIPYLCTGNAFCLQLISTFIRQLCHAYIHLKSFQKLNTLPSALPPANYNDANKTTDLHRLYTWNKTNNIKQRFMISNKFMKATVAQLEIQNLNKHKWCLRHGCEMLWISLKFMQVWMIVKLLMILPIRSKPPNLHGCCLAKTLGLGWRSCFDTNFPNVIHWISIGYHIHKLHHHSLNLTVRQWLEVSHVFFFNWATRSSPHFQSHFLFACSLYFFFVSSCVVPDTMKA